MSAVIQARTQWETKDTFLLDFEIYTVLCFVQRHHVRIFSLQNAIKTHSLSLQCSMHPNTLALWDDSIMSSFVVLQKCCSKQDLKMSNAQQLPCAIVTWL
jgi:hypothetical protein